MEPVQFVIGTTYEAGTRLLHEGIEYEKLKTGKATSYPKPGTSYKRITPVVTTDTVKAELDETQEEVDAVEKEVDELEQKLEEVAEQVTPTKYEIIPKDLPPNVYSLVSVKEDGIIQFKTLTIITSKKVRVNDSPDNLEIIFQ